MYLDKVCAFQGKLHDNLKEHEGQLCASMHACREQYLRRLRLKKRKRDADSMTQASAPMTMCCSPWHCLSLGLLSMLPHRIQFFAIFACSLVGTHHWCCYSARSWSFS